MAEQGQYAAEETLAALEWFCDSIGQSSPDAVWGMAEWEIENLVREWEDAHGLFAPYSPEMVERGLMEWLADSRFNPQKNQA